MGEEKAAGRDGSTDGTRERGPGMGRRVLNALGLSALVALCALAVYVQLGLVKTDEQWRSDYDGEWGLRAARQAPGPELALAGIILEPGEHDVGCDARLVISGRQARLIMPGASRDYSFSFSKQGFSMEGLQEEGGREGANGGDRDVVGEMAGASELVGLYVSGLLVVRDGEHGIAAVFEKAGGFHELADG